MIEDRWYCSAVSIPNTGVLVIGGVGINGENLRTTELLTRRSGEVVYFQGRIFVVGCMQCVNTMEMLDVAVGGYWTILNLFGPSFETSLTVRNLVRVGSDLFVRS
ncbi:unnamed protein product [Hymenolepis diminuta]|uniref:Uncharacterized protein n=1 Tax=Hymenolepis diminuta TaxID=6216 RepID=A0A564Y0E9_HYMDI|nr:unnamed protein product [Hymenolepis diminuta]